ncbi:MAG: 3-ketoacyl-ACP reductase [Planctomycetota bacterium]|nr:MAG: 3-ketoacyl-ACP reductase [Planctomycetota bacterium]REJ93799.1 MAG: 3-ketoacyl-ACP reductase [Planctomycetota bacterium]REK21135.1 MAG: 3-ketoacyl-ACP reductase [Planctomycetota bacterium]REK29543.1 MAG: 3-ketoacyl-ACP reductase [Planctomycetota bacterium]
MAHSSSQVALITGGTRGIGLGIARCLAADGCRLALNGMRDESDVQDVLAELKDSGAAVIYCRGDVSRAEDRQRMIDEVRNHYGRLDVLVNNAGITSPGRKDLLEADEDSFDRVVGVNLKGPFFLTQLAARWMVQQQAADESFRGVVINVSSVSAEIISTNRGDYCLTKAATGMATRLWAARLAEHNIEVYELQPGVIRSDMTAPVTDKYDRLFEEGLALQRRWGEPEDVGRAAAMLVRGDLPYATGQVLKIDGGMTIRQM